MKSSSFFSVAELVEASLQHPNKLRRSDSFQAGDEARSAESLQNKIAKKIKAPKVRQKNTSVVPSALFISSWL